MTVLDVCAFLRYPHHTTTHNIVQMFLRYPHSSFPRTYFTLVSMKHLRVFVEAFIEREMTGAKVLLPLHSPML